MAMWDQGRLGVGNERSFPAGKCLGVFDWAHLAQENTYVFAHTGPPILIFNEFPCVPGCPVASELCAQAMSLAHSRGGTYFW